MTKLIVIIIISFVLRQWQIDAHVPKNSIAASAMNVCSQVKQISVEILQ